MMSDVGILAIDRAMDKESIISRELYDQHRESYDVKVDYAIQPTL